MDVDVLTKALSEYSPTVSATTDLIATAVRPIGLILISIFFLIEMDAMYKYLKQEGAGFTQEVWMVLAVKYILAYLLVMMSSQIFDAILELNTIILKAINHVVPYSKVKYDMELGKIKGAVIKQFFTLVGGCVRYVSEISTKLIVMMCYFEMYLLKAVGPLIVAFFMSDATRNIAINILKMFGAVAFQLVIIFIVIRLYPVLVTDDLLKVKMSGSFEAWMTAFASIAKGIIFIFLLFSSQKKAKSLLNAM
ncbi:hypothetical protein ACR3IL_09040 [Streptococcus iniae]|uniref:hypothetical protein n=1 Tax=Streptococcus agalactiae TaxID=1311 RepID=UPI0008D8FE5E|nr:hypothetical protein [Streptococcus agalactiae]ELY5747366.1 hypothetical protein [Streptococcus iniae]KAF0052051.1 hypothetical protein GL192_00795 [Streptococcus agalactiae]OHX26615.1 hypothetical protein BKX95_09565 [Streptococcus iniae]